jgi:hypothetical protein
MSERTLLPQSSPANLQSDHWIESQVQKILLPINISQDKAEPLAGVFGCTVGTYSFTYLGITHGNNQTQSGKFCPLVSRIERRISATATWLTMAGRATLVDMVISSVPIYTMCSIKMHATKLHSIDRIRKTGLWRGSDVAGKGKPMVAWKKVATPKEKGGLGLKDLRIMNEALLTKHLHKLYNKEEVPWVQLV